MPGHSFMALHLDRGWQWKERNPSVEILSETSNISADSSRQWSDTNVFPSEIHVELLHAGRIPDPYVGFNEHLVQCAYSQPAEILRCLTHAIMMQGLASASGFTAARFRSMQMRSVRTSHSSLTGWTHSATSTS